MWSVALAGRPGKLVCTHTTAGHCNSHDFPRDASSQWSASIGGLQALQRFIQGYDWVFEMLFPQIQACLCSSQNVTFASWIIVFLLPVPGCLHCPTGFCFLTLAWLFSSCCLAHIFAVTVQFVPFFPFNSLIDCLAESMPVRTKPAKVPSCFPQCDSH